MNRTAVLCAVCGLLGGSAASTAQAPSPRAPPLSPTEVTWASVPAAEQLQNAYPPKALADLTSGLVSLKCRIAADGGLEDCAILTEK